ncbi:pilus assembly protein TadG-related protein [Roseateles sp.]|uniref:pilus assembly protein TadG-related protein n=1 Tax=Roseateles sp. TaxID=1971397 RepID=UPI0032639852
MKINASVRSSIRGQAAIWLLGTLAASAAVMYAVFNTGQVIVGKQRAVNTADAAALAGAQAEARLLNLMAYGNRGIIANEVLLAQMLSLESWTQYVGRTAGNIKTVLDVLSLIPPLTAFAQTVSRVMGQAQNISDKGHDALKKVIDVLIPALEVAKGGLKGAEAAINKLGGVIAGDAAKNIVAANRTNFNGRWDSGVALANTGAVHTLTLAQNNLDWIAFTKLYDGKNRGDAQYILENSIDNFTRYRPGQSWLNVSLDLLGVGMEKSGGSRLTGVDKGLDRWESQDTLEQWTAPPLGVFCKGNCKTYIPIGWGRSNADEKGKLGSVWSPNRIAQKSAYSGGGKHDGWSGVPALYDIKEKSIDKRENLGIDFIVAVSRDGANDFTTTSVPMGSPLATSVAGSPDMPLKQRAAQNTAFSKARVFFERPRRGLTNDFTASGLWRPDSAKEYGSLYSPYWQARLRDLTTGEKTVLLGAMGLTPDYVLVTPGGQ